jgi:hypothetical protein
MNMRFKAWFLALVLVIGIISIQKVSYAGPLTLTSGGTTLFTIVRASDAIPSEIKAADQLQTYLEGVTGVTVPIQEESAVVSTAPQILVGAGARVKSLLPTQDWNALGKDGIVIKTVGNSLILAGGRPRGSLYAVFQFLENEVGCKWWTQTASTIPSRPNLTIANQNVTYVPPFSYRENYSNGPMGTEPLFPTTLRENGHHQKQPADWGGHYNILGFVHTFSQLLPPSTYFAAHPDWYSDPNNGNLPCTATSAMPDPQQTQLCATNPGVVAEISAQAVQWVTANPQAGYISISQNDSFNYCACTNCRTLAAQEGSEAGPYLQLVNSVASAVHAVNPDFLVETLAYQGSEKPPANIHPASNVIIRLAPVTRDFGKPFNSTANQASWDNFQDWAGIANNLFFWNYVTNFEHLLMPHPNWPHLAPDLQAMAANNVKGVFEQGNTSTNDVGDFNPMRAWIIGKLMWNPTLDMSTLRDEYLTGYYGAAGPYLKQYLQRVQTSYDNVGLKLGCFNNHFGFLTLDVMNNATTDFANALLAVQGNAQLTDRVQRERLSLELAWIFRYKLLKEAAGPGGTFLGPSDPLQAIDDFEAHATSYGITTLGGNRSMAAAIAQMKAWFAPPLPVPPFAQPYPAKDIIDIQPELMSLESPVATIVTDSNASNSTAVKLTANSPIWAIQAWLNNLLPGPQRYRAFAVARVETPGGVPATGKAFDGGIYNAATAAFEGSFMSPTASAIQGSTYQIVDLGTFDFNPNQYIWFARSNNSNISALYIDRVILIRDAVMPSFAQPFPRADIIDYQPPLMELDGAVASIVTDSNASNNNATKMNTGVYSWAIQAKLNKFLTASETYRVYALARVETPGGVPATGSAFEAGIYNPVAATFDASFTSPTAASLQGSTYKAIDFGTHTFSPNQYIWFSRPSNSNISALYIDRIILIRDVPLPTFAQSVPRSDVLDYQPSLLELVNPLATVVADSNASDNTSAKMLTNTYAWSIQAKLNKFITASGSYRVYAVVRTETPGGVPATGNAFESGIYDPVAATFGATLTSPTAASLLGNTYQTLNLGKHTFNPNQYIWFAPPSNSNISALYIDRIILVKEP